MKTDGLHFHKYINKILFLINNYSADVLDSLSLLLLLLLLCKPLCLLWVHLRLLLLIVNICICNVSPHVSEEFVANVTRHDHVDPPSISCETDKELAEQVYRKDIKSVAGSQALVKAGFHHSVEKVSHSREQY